MIENFQKEGSNGQTHDFQSRPPTPSSIISASSKSGQLLNVHDRKYDDRKAALSRQISRATVSIEAAAAMGQSATSQDVTRVTTTDPAFEIDFAGGDDKDNPRNWSLWYRALILLFMSFSTTIVVMYSTSFASGIPGMMETFGISNSTVVVLGITTYLFGLAFGCVILAPLSEMYGRKPIYVVSMALFVIFVIPCGLAQNLETMLIARFLGAFAASAMIGNSPGTVSDIVTDEYRALAFSIWSIGPMNGPVIGPLVGGFVFQSLGWRWTNWVVMIGGGVSFILVASFKETYAPAILRKLARDKRKGTGDDRWHSRYDDKMSFWPLLKINLSRPFVMMVTEPICIFWDLYIGLVYAILYLCFVAYPIVFSEQRGWAPGVTGLSYGGMAIGCCIVIATEPLIRKIINRQRPRPDLPLGVPLPEPLSSSTEIEGNSSKDISTENNPEPEAMVLIVLIGSILIPVGELLFSWTSPPWIHWIFPILAGIPFGMGNCAVFIYATSYLVDSYGVYAASALAGNAVLRSAFGGTLPLAAPGMYRVMGSRWAGTLLGGLELLCIPIPYVFWKHGWKIRQKSSLIRKMKADQKRLQRRKLESDAKAEPGVLPPEDNTKGCDFEEVDIDRKAKEKEVLSAT